MTVGGIVTVKIAKGVKHHIHRVLLVQHSDYFKMALQGPWKEAEEGVVRLDDVENGLFDIFVTWLYTQKLPAQVRADGPSQDDKDIAELNSVVLGDRLSAPAFKEAAQKQFIDKYTANRKVPPISIIISAFGSLPAQSPILEMLADLHVLFYVEKAAAGCDEAKIEIDLPHNFLLRIMHKYAQRKTAICNLHVSPCNYLRHNSAYERRFCTKC